MIIHSSTEIDVPVTSKALHKATLMKEDYIKLSFSDTVDYKFKAGDYVEYEGLKYYLPDDYIPTMSDELTFSYDLQFNAPWYNLDSYMFLFNTYVDGVITKRESDWYITDTAANIIALLIRNLKDETRSCPCVFEDLFYCEGTEARTFTFSKTSILATLNNLAKEFELEWWVEVDEDKFYLHFGECDNSLISEFGSTVFNEDGSRQKDSSKAVELVSGGNVSKPSVSQKQGLKRYYYVFGSSRNIDQTVDLEENDGKFITSIVTKRLALDNPLDMEEGVGEEVVIFDDIYPRSDYQITGVTPVYIQSDEVAGYDSEGNPVYKSYNVYNLKIKAFSDYIFSLIEKTKEDKEELLRRKNAGEITEAEYETLIANLDGVECIEDVIASGKPLSLKFLIKNTGTETLTPKLAGFEFELGAILNTNPTTGEQWYEFQIIKQDVNGYIIPNEVLIPQVGDWVCIFNIKGKYIDGNEEANAKTELLAEFNKWYANQKKNVSYTVKPLPDSDLNLNIGDAVKLTYLDNEVVSRVYAFEKKLDYTVDASYTISSYATQGTVNQLKEEVKTLTANIANGTAFKLDTETISNILRTYGKNMFLSKTAADTASGVINFLQGLTAGQWSAGGTGAAIFKNNDGNWVIEGDYLHVRKKFTAESIEILHSSHIGGKLVATPASMVVSRIEYPEGVEENGVIVVPYYKVFFNTEDSDGNKVFNQFEVGDLAYCETFNLEANEIGSVHSGVNADFIDRTDATNESVSNNHFYWRKVIDKGDDWIALSNKSGEYAAESDYPLVGDTITLLGSQHIITDGEGKETEDSDRQNAIVIAGAGTGNPYIRLYTSINSFALPIADVQISPYGSWITVTDRNGTKVKLTELINSLEGQIVDVQEQTDKQIVLWFGEEIPTLLNEPAKDWSVEEMAEHVHDIYYNKGYAKTGGGRAYSFEPNTVEEAEDIQLMSVQGDEAPEEVAGGYHWVEITDKDMLASLEAANKAQDTADGKRRVFVARPTASQVYDVGDLWVNATFPTEASDGESTFGDSSGVIHTVENPLYNNDILRCVIPKEEGVAFSISHWQPVQKYTSSKIEQTASEINLTITDLETGLETAGVHIDGASSKITLNAQTTDVSNDLVVKRLETRPDTSKDENNKARVVIGGSTLNVYGTDGSRNIEFGVDDNGFAVLKYYNNNGQLLYDLGPNGMNWNDVSEERFYSFSAVFISSDTSAQGDHSESTAGAVTLYRYQAKSINGTISGGDATNHDAAIAKAAHGLYFTSQAIVSNSELDTSVLARGLYRGTDAEIGEFAAIEKYITIDDAKEALKDDYGLTQAEVDAFDWTLDENAPTDTLLYPIYSQEYLIFTDGKLEIVRQFWQK